MGTLADPASDFGVRCDYDSEANQIHMIEATKETGMNGEHRLVGRNQQL